MAESKSVDLLGTGAVRDIVKWILIALAIGIVGFIGWKIYKKIKSNQIKKNSDVSGTTVVNGTKVNVNLGTIATNIDEAFHGSWDEDEEAAMIELLKCPKPLIPQLSDVYYKIDGNILKQDFVKYLSTDDYNKIRSQFE